jgi:hypothetical protein
MTYWEFKGRELINCTCEYGCNCQFNALPDKGHCHAVAAIQIDEGRHGDTRLDEALAFVDERADEKQREALLRIMTGQDTDPMSTVFAVFAATIETMHEPVFAPIQFEVDVDGRRGRMTVPGYVEMTGEPIRNPVSGAEFRGQIRLPDGFEYEVAEIGSATSRTTGGPMDIDIQSKYAQFAHIHMSTHGVVRA